MTSAQFARLALNNLRAVKLRNAPPAGYLGADQYEILGVYTKDVEKIGREMVAELPEDWFSALNELRAMPVFEAKVLATDIAVRIRKRFEKSHWSKFSKWLDDCEGWALVDNLCCNLLSVFLQRWPELVAKTVSWTRSRNLWKRRASLVVLVRPARTGEFAEELFERAAILAADHDPRIYKAVSWALRSVPATHRAQLVRFLHDYSSVLKPVVIREVRAKLITGRKTPAKSISKN